MPDFSRCVLIQYSVYSYVIQCSVYSSISTATTNLVKWGPSVSWIIIWRRNITCLLLYPLVLTDYVFQGPPPLHSLISTALYSVLPHPEMSKYLFYSPPPHATSQMCLVHYVTDSTYKGDEGAGSNQTLHHTHFVASSMFFRVCSSLGSACCRLRYSLTALVGNSVSQM